MLRTLPASKPPIVKDIYQSSLAAAESSFHAAQRKASSLTRRVRRFADERPLHFVGMIAGVALVAGVALRIWRSKPHA